MYVRHRLGNSEFIQPLPDKLRHLHQTSSSRSLLLLRRLVHPPACTGAGCGWKGSVPRAPVGVLQAHIAHTSLGAPRCSLTPGTPGVTGQNVVPCGRPHANNVCWTRVGCRCRQARGATAALHAASEEVLCDSVHALTHTLPMPTPMPTRPRALTT